MILATTKVKDLDHFLEVYGTAGADKRGSHGSKGSTVYRDPIEEDRVWAIFDWDEAGWTAFATDPETPGIMQEAGHLGRPSLGQFLGTFSAQTGQRLGQRWDVAQVLRSEEQVVGHVVRLEDG